MAPREKSPTSNLSAVDWVEAALEALAEGGLEGVQVTKIAARLSVTKGSFYWHFKDRRALLDAMLERWANDRTAELVRFATRGIDDPHERLEALARLSRQVADIDRAMRMWAKSDPAAASAVMQADRQALSHIVDALLAYGFTERDATIRARLLLLLVVGSYSIDRRLGRISGSRGDAAALAVVLAKPTA